LVTGLQPKVRDLVLPHTTHGMQKKRVKKRKQAFEAATFVGLLGVVSPTLWWAMMILLLVVRFLLDSAVFAIRNSAPGSSLDFQPPFALLVVQKAVFGFGILWLCLLIARAAVVFC